MANLFSGRQVQLLQERGERHPTPFSGQARDTVLQLNELSGKAYLVSAFAEAVFQNIFAPKDHGSLGEESPDLDAEPQSMRPEFELGCALTGLVSHTYWCGFEDLLIAHVDRERR
jgi:hypothetical protein